MRFYKMDQDVVEDIKFANEHSTLFDLKSYIREGIEIVGYNPHQKEVNIPIRQRKDKDGFYITIQPQFRVQIPTGIALSIPVKYQLRVTSFKELAFKNGVTLFNGMEIYDNDYTEEIKVTLFNNSDTPVYIYSNEVIAQATLNKVLEYTLDATNRKVAVKVYEKEDEKEKDEE